MNWSTPMIDIPGCPPLWLWLIICFFLAWFFMLGVSVIMGIILWRWGPSSPEWEELERLVKKAHEEGKIKNPKSLREIKKHFEWHAWFHQYPY